MKIVELDIVPYFESDFFNPIRSKIDFAKIVLLSARSLLLDYPSEGLIITSRMKLVIDKMSRLFFYQSGKFYSISFPLTVELDQGKVVKLATYSGRVVDSYTISVVLTILNDQIFLLNPSPIDFYMGSDGSDAFGLALIEEIFQFEPAYLRYDCDSANENGKLHPLYHLDVNYSQYGTYKLGLNQAIVEAYFENILNIRTDCSFLVD